LIPQLPVTRTRGSGTRLTRKSIDSRIFRRIAARTQSCSFVLCNRVRQHGLIHADSNSNSSSRCPCTGDQDLRVDVQIPSPAKSASGATCLRDKRRTSCQFCSCFFPRSGSTSPAICVGVAFQALVNIDFVMMCNDVSGSHLWVIA
jgi:hypothetical protein